MRTIIKSLVLLFTINLILVSCGSKTDRDSDFLPLVKIQIPEEIKGDQELVDLIKSSEKSINEFSDNIERLAVDGKDILSKKEEDYTLTDGLKAGKLMLQFVSNSTQMTSAMQNFTTYVEKKQEQGIINEQQYKALEQVGKSLENRIDQINKKYKNYFEKK
jgi:polyhydroxyalkanoate synthesis regulator protein